MKVMQLHNWYRIRGGADVLVESIVKLLKQRGVEVSTIARHSDDLSPGLKGKAHAFATGIYSLTEKRLMTSVLTQQQPDVVHAHNIYPLFSPSILVSCRQLNVPTVMTCHTWDLTCPTYFHFRDGIICESCSQGREYWCVVRNCRNNILESIAYALRFAAARRLRLFHKNVTLFVVVSRFVKNKLTEVGFPEERIIVLPNMVYLPNSDTKSHNGHYVAFAGRISPEKGIETLLSAAKQTQLPVWLAGNYSTMRERIKEVPPNVRFVGHLDRDRLAEFYRDARFLVIPSICFETFALVAAEAMSHSLPVIASRIGGLPEIVDDGVTGLLFEPGNSEELADMMRLLWGNPNLCEKMGKAGREKVIREYSEDIYYERLIATYNKAIEINNVK